jgi:hypothetical protein
MALGIDQPKSHPPGHTDHNPAVDAEMRPQPLDVRDEMIGCVDRQVGIGLADQRAAPPAAALVKQRGPICIRIEVASGLGCAAAARAAVQPDGGQALRGADRLPIQGLAVTNLECTDVVRHDGFVQILHTVRPWLWRKAPQQGCNGRSVRSAER